MRLNSRVEQVQGNVESERQPGAGDKSLRLRAHVALQSARSGLIEHLKMKEDLNRSSLSFSRTVKGSSLSERMETAPRHGGHQGRSGKALE